MYFLFMNTTVALPSLQWMLLSLFTQGFFFLPQSGKAAGWVTLTVGAHAEPASESKQIPYCLGPNEIAAGVSRKVFTRL